MGELRQQQAPVPPLEERHPAPTRERLALRSVARSLAVSTAITVLYFVLPLRPRAWGAVLTLAIGLLVVAAVVVWQVVLIVRSPYPGLQALTTLALVIPLFLVGFAATYFILSSTDQAAFSASLTRLDAAYFAVTTFATVGFGDIVARSEVARAVVTVQMLAGLVLVGIVARVVVGAVQEGRSRRRTSSD
ncbi:potassium channel family protein [Phycicoccus sp. M110.8]|uniref:potassium channel family protein n=1 Tax=Phycicoccus sp. M110.8 TaxID=3075433 RepID=UPI0028FD13F5|nr:potassium channel family protein [Phycicoccus sp. M110.8]MDU0314163.1 potassium channel family protein [Phycicoccus sp. M110.8]